eukprot:tig00000663_g2996.t1
MPDSWAEPHDFNYSEVKMSKKIGSGLTAEIYKGTYRGASVAVKIMKRHPNDNYVQMMFRKEVDLLSCSCICTDVLTHFFPLRSQHPNIVTFVGAYQDDKIRALVMEFLPGLNMYQRLHGEKPKPPKRLEETLRMALDISRAIAFMHENGFIHRDLKSSNLMTTDEGIVKLIDLGLSRDDAADGRMTGETGSYRWAAPEVLRNEPYHRSADVFSFGIVMWEIITGDLPYGRLTPLEAAMGVATKGVRPSKLKPGKNVNEELIALIEQCWAERPDERPPMSEVAVRVEAILRAAEPGVNLDLPPNATRLKSMPQRSESGSFFSKIADFFSGSKSHR